MTDPRRAWSKRVSPGWAVPFIMSVLLAGQATAQERRPREPADTVPTLGLDQGLIRVESGPLVLELVRASQTAASLRPEGGDDFDFTPSDWLERRGANGYFHLGDLTLRLRRPGPDAPRGRSPAS
jgi:hypothetical protein